MIKVLCGRYLQKFGEVQKYFNKIFCFATNQLLETCSNSTIKILQQRGWLQFNVNFEQIYALWERRITMKTLRLPPVGSVFC